MSLPIFYQQSYMRPVYATITPRVLSAFARDGFWWVRDDNGDRVTETCVPDMYNAHKYVAEGGISLEDMQIIMRFWQAYARIL